MKRRTTKLERLLFGCLMAGAIGASASVVSPVDEIGMVSHDGDVNNVGSNNHGLTGTFDFAVRERRSAGQSDRRLVSYVKFDLSGLTTGFVNSVDFESTLTLDYSHQLNTANSASVRVAPVAGGNTWSDAPGSYPLASWYSPDQSSTGLEVIANVASQDPATATDEIVLDVTSWVRDWVNGTTANNGLAFFVPILESQAAGFTVTSLVSVDSLGDEVTFTGAVDGDWSKTNNWDTGNYPTSSDIAVLNSTAFLANGVPNNILATRLGIAGAGTLNLQPGSALQATSNRDWESHVGTTGHTGTLNHSGGTNQINTIEIGRGGTGLVDLSGGQLTLTGDRDGSSIFLGTDDDMSIGGGDGTIEISGGALDTRAGVYLGSPDGSGVGTFSVQGAGATEVGIGSHGDTDGAWQQNANSVLRVGISTNGVTPIRIADTASAGSPVVTFAAGSVLDVAFVDGAMETNAWPVMISEGTMTDFGIVFDPGMGSTTSDWGFIASNNTLYVGYGLGWPAGGESVDGQTNLIHATFNDTDDGLNENFNLLSNGAGNPTWNNATGEASMSLEDPSSGAVGCVSDASVDGAVYAHLTISFVMDDITDPDNGPSHNGHWIGLIGTHSELWNNAQLAGGADGWALGIRFLSGAVTFVYDNASGNEVTMGSLGTYTVASLQDGYAAEMIVTTNGWAVAIDGIDSSTGGSGAWPAEFDYATIDADTNVFVAMTYQQGAESGTVVDLASISVSGIEGPSDDRDGDGIPNDYEEANGLDPDDETDRDTDLDGDGLSNVDEYTRGTFAHDPDSDNDLLDDGEEVHTHSTDPLDADSDDDFLNDYDEIAVFRTDPDLKDSDLDGVDDGTELGALSNPLDLSITPTGQDSDEDGLLDSVEMAAFGNLDSSGLDDNDLDNYPNIVEQAFGSLLDDSGSTPELQFNSLGELSFRRHLLAGIGYELQVSEDLESWSSFLGYLTEDVATPVDDDFEQANYQASLEPEKLFMRVEPRTEITRRPNIVLIYTDDQGYGDMSTNNPHSKFSTPALDQLAAQGINFTDGHCSDTVCSPSRYGLLTGRYCWRTRLKTNVLGADEPALIPDHRMTLASLLRDNGYATAMVGKWHLGMDIPGSNGNRSFAQPIDDMPLDVGFDYFYGIPASLNFGYLAWIEGRHTAVNPTLFTGKKPNPLPGAFSDYRITPPYDRTSGLEAAPDFDDVVCLTRFTDKAIEWMEQQVDDARAGNPFLIYIPYTSPHKPVIPRDDFLGLSGAGAYGDFMMETDYHVGNILTFLDESGLANNTMVIFTSDNGPETTYNARVSTYDHDSAGIYRGGKRFIYEGGHRVPFVIRWPAGIPSPGRVWDKPVCQTDLLATLADMLGITLDDNSGEDSVSFYDVLRDETADLDRLPMVHHEFNGRFAVRHGDWKLLMPWEGASYELYNLSTDPTELNNVYAGNPTIATNLEAVLTDIVTSGRTTVGADVGNDTGWWDDLEWINPEDY